MVKKLAIFLYFAVVLGSTANASTIIGINAISSPQGDFGSPFALVNAINQSGLSAGYTSGVTDFASYTAGATHSSPGSINSGFTNTRSLPQIFSLDIGSMQTIDGFAIWANENPGSLTSFNLWADTDNNFGNGVGSLLGSFNVSGSSTISSADVGSFLAVSTQYLHIDATAPSDLIVGIGEFALRSAAAAVPEPTSLALLTIGLLGLGFKRRSGS